MLSKGKQYIIRMMQIFKITTTSSCFHLSKHHITFGVDWQAFEVWLLRQIFQAVLLTFFLEDLTSDFLHRGWRAAFCGYKIYSTFFTVDILHRSWSGLSLMCYKILQVVLWNFWTEIGGLPLLVSLQIWTTSLKSGKPLVSTLE